MSMIGKRILIVEDTPSISLFITANLRNAGANVTVATTTEQALHLYEEALETKLPYELLLVDLNLPDSDGTQVLKKVKKDSHHTTCIAMSADNTVTSQQKALSAGAAQFIEKPFDITELLTVIGEKLHERDTIKRHIAEQDIDAQTKELQRSYVIHLQELSRKLVYTIPYRQLCSLVHQIKGSAMLYGYTELSKAASNCIGKLKETGPTATQEMRKYLKMEIDNTLTPPL